MNIVKLGVKSDVSCNVVHTRLGDLSLLIVTEK